MEKTGESLFLAYPTGRLGGWMDRVVVGAAYGAGLGAGDGISVEDGVILLVGVDLYTTSLMPGAHEIRVLCNGDAARQQFLCESIS